MDGQAGKGKEFCTQRLDFQSLTGFQGDRDEEGNAYRDLGNIYFLLGDFRTAIEYHEEDLKIAIEIGDRVGEGGAYGNLGNAYDSISDFRKSIEYHEKDLKIAIEIGHRAVEGQGYENLGNACNSMGDFRKAIEYHEKALKIALEIGDRAGEAGAYGNLGNAYRSMGHFRKAIGYHQKDFKIAIEIDDRAGEGRAYANLGNAYFSLSDFQKAIECHEKHLKIAIEIGDRAGEGKAFGNLGNASRSLGDFRKAIEYHEKIGAEVEVRCEDRTFDELENECPARREVCKEVEKSCQSSKSPFGPFYDAVIGPIFDLLGFQLDELVIVSDGAMCLTPWAAVVESIRIRTVPSLTSYQLISSVPEGYHKKTGALLVGNPCLDDLEKPLHDLPCAQAEVEMIASILNTRPLTGREATKAEVIKRMSSVGSIHIAAHGNKPTGEIALSPNLGWTFKFPREKDFILKMSDVQAANLRARLVVLSCCHSGRGRILKGEGVVGIARAFLAAGARSVLICLWAIVDEATMVFMKSFYQHLKDGKPASTAVHQTMKSLRESEKFSEMSYWAAFQLIEDDVKVEFEANDDVTN